MSYIQLDFTAIVYSIAKDRLAKDSQLPCKQEIKPITAPCGSDFVIAKTGACPAEKTSRESPVNEWRGRIPTAADSDFN
jgi:hypothetical protein